MDTDTGRRPLRYILMHELTDIDTDTEIWRRMRYDI